MFPYKQLQWAHVSWYTAAVADDDEDDNDAVVAFTFTSNMRRWREALPSRFLARRNVDARGSAYPHSESMMSARRWRNYAKIFNVGFPGSLIIAGRTLSLGGPFVPTSCRHGFPRRSCQNVVLAEEADVTKFRSPYDVIAVATGFRDITSVDDEGDLRSDEADDRHQK